MALPLRFNEKAWPLLVGALIVTGIAWGIYAWKASSGISQSPAVSLGSSSTESSRPLMATRGVPSSDSHSSGDMVTEDGIVLSDSNLDEPSPESANDIGSMVHANRAPSMDKPMEITLDRSASTRPLRSAATEFTEGCAEKKRGDLVSARISLSRAILKGLPTADAATAREELEKISQSLTFSRAVDPQDPLAKACVIGGGDSLYAMANRFQVTPELLASINKIADPGKVMLGAKVKAIQGPFRVVIRKKEYRLEVYIGDIYLRSFKVGLGTEGSTPLGRWRILNKLSNPDWTDPKSGQFYAANDPGNPIGERWIGLQCISGDCMGRTGFGIHGTIDPGSIGSDMSMGCVRLAPNDIAMLYDLLVPKYSTVEIVH